MTGEDYTNIAFKLIRLRNKMEGGVYYYASNSEGTVLKLTTSNVQHWIDIASYNREMNVVKDKNTNWYDIMIIANELYRNLVDGTQK